MARLSARAARIQAPLVALCLALLAPLLACSSSESNEAGSDLPGEQASPALPELGMDIGLPAADGADVLVGLRRVGQPAQSVELRIARLRPDGTFTTLGTIPDSRAARELGIDADSVLAMLDGFVYFRATGRRSVGRLSLGGGQPELLPFVTSVAENGAFRDFFPYALAARRDGLFVGAAGSGNKGQIWAIAPDGSSAQLIVGSLPAVLEFPPKRLWASPKRLVWLDGSRSIKALDLAEGSKDMPAIRTLEADASNLQLATATASADAIFAFRPAPGAPGSVVRIPQDGGPMTTVVEGLQFVSGMAVDEAHLYFSHLQPDHAYVIEEVVIAPGGAPGSRRVIARSANPLGPFVLTTTHVVWRDKTRKQFRRAPKG